MTATPAAEPLPGFIVDYLTARDRERHQQAAEAFGALTDRERALFREAAVMGFVQGLMRTREEMLRDSQIVALVVEACLAAPDLYPTISNHQEQP